MSPIEKYSTRAVKRDFRLPFWNSVVSNVYGGTQISSPASDFIADVWRWQIGRVNMLRPRSPCAHIERFRDIHEGPRSNVVIHIQHRGNTRIRQGGRELELQPGDAAIHFNCEFYELDLSDENELFSAEFPIDILNAHGGCIEAFCGVRLDRLSGSTQLLHRFIWNMWDVANSSQDIEVWSAEATRSIGALLWTATESRTSTLNPLRSLCERLVCFTQSRIWDPDLNTEVIANEMGLTARSIQIAFAKMGTTPSAYILEQRLNLASELLRIDKSISITEIAFRSGFSDSSYFARCFRSKFGTTPRLWRSC